MNSTKKGTRPFTTVLSTFLPVTTRNLSKIVSLRLKEIDKIEWQLVIVRVIGYQSSFRKGKEPIIMESFFEFLCQAPLVDNCLSGVTDTIFPTDT
jgi:hypothetical protein